MRHVTVRNLPDPIAKALEKEKRRRGQSLNQTVIELLRQVLGLRPDRKPSNGLARLGGSWSAEELKRFEAATALTEQIDEELWR